jgi:hypothetical protein
MSDPAIVRGIDAVTPKFIVDWMTPSTENGKRAVMTYASLYAAIVIISIVLMIFSLVVSLITGKKSGFESFGSLVSAPPLNNDVQSAVMTASLLGFKSIKDNFSGAPTDIGPGCGDNSADMNYAMNIIQQRNPSALNSPFWGGYYKLLYNYVLLKNAANADSTLASDANNAFDLLREYEEQTGFNPLQINMQKITETGNQVVSQSANVVADVLPGQATAGFARTRFDTTARSGVGGFANKRDRFDATSRSRVGGFRSGRYAGVGAVDDSNTSAAAVIAGASSKVGMIGPLNIGGNGNGAQHYYQPTNPMSGYPTQTMSNGSGLTIASYHDDDTYHNMLLAGK